MTNVAAPVRTRGSSPSGDTPGAKQRSITNKEGVNGAKHQEGGRPGNAVKTTFINVDGLVCGLKLERLCEHIAQHHIAVLVETRTNNVVPIFATALPTYNVYHIPISSTMIGRKGNGVSVLIDQSIHDFVTVWHVSEQIQAIWLAEVCRAGIQCSW